MPLYGYTYYILHFVYSFVSVFLANKNNATMSTHVQVLCKRMFSILLGIYTFIPRSRTVGVREPHFLFYIFLYFLKVFQRTFTISVINLKIVTESSNRVEIWGFVGKILL